MRPYNHTFGVMCNPYLCIIEAAANIAKQHDALVPDGMLEQSRNITTTTLKISDLEAQISGMRRDIAELNLTLSANQRRFDKNIEQTSQAEYQTLFTKIHSKLPRELRDEIYSYLVIPTSQPIVVDLVDLSAPTDVSNSNNAHNYIVAIHPSPLQSNDPLFLPEWVGHDAASELLETYYSNNAFDISIDPNSAMAARMWLREHMVRGWNGVRHPFDKVKKMHIRIRCEDLDHRTCVGGDAERGRGEPATQKYMKRILHGCLGPFAAAVLAMEQKKKGKTELEISLHTAFTFESEEALYEPVELEPHERKMWLGEEVCFYNMLEAVRGRVCALMRGCVTVKVTHRDQKSSGRMPEGRDLTPFFRHMLAWVQVDEVEEIEEDIPRDYIPLWEVEADTDACEVKLRDRLRGRWHMRYALPWGLIDFADMEDPDGLERNLGVIE